MEYYGKGGGGVSIVNYGALFQSAMVVLLRNKLQYIYCCLLAVPWCCWDGSARVRVISQRILVLVAFSGA